MGGLLVDHQTFVISETNSEGIWLRDICAFNLLSGALALESNNPNDLNLYIPRPIRQYYTSAPTVTAFDDNVYDISDENSIINVMKDFYDNDNAISYQRIKDRNVELTTWLEICRSLPFIEDFFNNPL